jgi:outer membrane lipoprotein carrier protein
MKPRQQWAAAALVVLMPLAALAADARSQLKHFVHEVQAASGQFTQSTVGAQGRTQPAQSGVFSFQRPGRFKWQVQKPYEQLIVSDGKQVLQYDPDLAQVTERDVDAVIGTSPAAILFGAGALEQVFDVQVLPDHAGLQWLRATPKTADAGFSRVDLGFSGNMPRQLELLDSFGQITHVVLSSIQPNPGLPAGEFSFAPVDDVDVVKM